MIFVFYTLSIDSYPLLLSDVRQKVGSEEDDSGSISSDDSDSESLDEDFDDLDIR